MGKGGQRNLRTKAPAEKAAAESGNIIILVAGKSELWLDTIPFLPSNSVGPYYIISSPLASTSFSTQYCKPRLLSKATGGRQCELSIRRSNIWIDGRMLMTVGSIAIKRSHFYHS